MITPTVGRKVWYYRDNNSDAQPLDATIVAVHGDRLVNLAVFDDQARLEAKLAIELVQEGDDEPAGQHCRWMPYQVGQAKR